MPQDDPWDADASREIARAGSRRALAEPDSFSPSSASAAEPEEVDEEQEEEVEVVPVRRQLSLAIAGFGGLLAVAMVLGAQTSAPDARWPYAVVIFGIQVLYLLAWIMALHPPAPWPTAGVCTAVALVADYVTVTSDRAGVLPLLYVALGGFVVAVTGQTFRAEDRRRVTDSWQATAIIVLGVAAYAMPVVLTRQTLGTQTVLVCLTAAGVALVVARATDAVFPAPRIAPQVPRGAAGVVLGAMLGTLAGAGLGSVLVLPFTPAKGAVIGLIAAVIANLVDLAVNFGQAGRRLAGDAPTFWLARHMQGPLGAFALVSPAAWLLTHIYLS
jgi:hypothetical protein